MHYIKEVNKFRAYEWLEKPIKIKIGKGIIWEIVREEIVINITISRVTIGGMLLVLELEVDANLLSISVLIKNGMGVNFEAEKVDFHKKGVIWGEAKLLIEDGGLLYIEEFEGMEKFALASKCIDRQLFMVWHRQLGYVNSRIIRSIIEKVVGIEIGDLRVKVKERNIDCVDCLRETQHQRILRYLFTKAIRP